MSQRKINPRGTKKWVIPLLLILSTTVIVILVFSPFSAEKSCVSAEITYNNNCGNCHLAPNPANIPKSIWKNNVLPEMAARMGYGNYGKDHYPKESMIDSAQWLQIQNYVLSLAPDSIPNVPSRNGRTEALSQFKPSLQTLGNPNIAGAITGWDD